eukprot:scaffold152082_cov30-Tisochrysis_lutea.AAC.2
MYACPCLRPRWLPGDPAEREATTRRHIVNHKQCTGGRRAQTGANTRLICSTTVPVPSCLLQFIQALAVEEPPRAWNCPHLARATYVHNNDRYNGVGVLIHESGHIKHEKLRRETSGMERLATSRTTSVPEVVIQTLDSILSAYYQVRRKPSAGRLMRHHALLAIMSTAPSSRSANACNWNTSRGSGLPRLLDSHGHLRSKRHTLAALSALFCLHASEYDQLIEAANEL